MNRDDLCYGARSGIQKAVRRGDLDLGKTCFDLLWSEKEHQSWLKWRAAILVTEEAWHLAGELATIMTNKDATERDWRKFVYQVVLAPKSKDSVGLWCLSTLHRRFRNKHMDRGMVRHPEMTLMDRVMAESKKDGKGDVKLAAEIAYDWAKERIDTDYEKAAIRFLRNRSGWGGMMGDRYFCIATILLIGLRRLCQADVLASIQDGASLWAARVGARRKPRTVELPWYIFDMHTQLGKIAFSIFMKHHAEKFNIGKEDADNWWFECESGVVIDELLKTTDIDPASPGILDNMWFPWHLKAGRTVAPFRDDVEAMEAWEAEGREVMKGCVEWIMEKRS